MSYNYAKINKFEKSQINGLTKKLIGERFNNSGVVDTWQKIFSLAKSYGMDVGYSYAHGERLDFIKSRKITKVQTDFGKKWLREYFFKMDGNPRSGKRTEWVSASVLEIAKKVTRFEFVGVQVLASQGWYPCQAVPIYRAYNSKGEYFDYSPIHWGNPIIHE